MNAKELYDLNPIGKLVAFSDGSPQPPARFTRKLSAWRRNNASGVFTERLDGRPADLDILPGFALMVHGGEVLRVIQHFSINSPKSFELVGENKI